MFKDDVAAIRELRAKLREREANRQNGHCKIGDILQQVVVGLFMGVGIYFTYTKAISIIATF